MIKMAKDKTQDFAGFRADFADFRADWSRHLEIGPPYIIMGSLPRAHNYPIPTNSFTTCARH